MRPLWLSTLALVLEVRPGEIRSWYIQRWHGGSWTVNTDRDNLSTFLRQEVFCQSVLRDYRDGRTWYSRKLHGRYRLRYVDATLGTRKTLENQQSICGTPCSLSNPSSEDLPPHLVVPLRDLRAPLVRRVYIIIYTWLWNLAFCTVQGTTINESAMTSLFNEWPSVESPTVSQRKAKRKKI